MQVSNLPLQRMFQETVEAPWWIMLWLNHLMVGQFFGIQIRSGTFIDSQILGFVIVFLCYPILFRVPKRPFQWEIRDINGFHVVSSKPVYSPFWGEFWGPQISANSFQIQVPWASTGIFFWNLIKSVYMRSMNINVMIWPSFNASRVGFENLAGGPFYRDFVGFFMQLSVM